MKKFLLLAFLAVAAAFGSPQYSGTVFSPTSFTADGVKQDLINSLETALLAGGWTTVSGHNTTNLLMQSGTTPAGLQIRVRFKDNAGTCIQIYMENTAGTLTPASYTVNTGGSLLATNGLVYNVIGSTYWFLAYTAVTTSSREWVYAGMPYLNSILAPSITNEGFLFSSSISDSDTGLRNNLRLQSSLTAGNNASNWEVMTNTTYVECNNSANNCSNNAPAGAGAPRLILGMVSADFAQYNSGVPGGYRWYSTGTPQVATGDVMFAWPLTVTTEAFIMGQAYDAIYVADSQPIGTTSTFASKNWVNMTNSWAGSTSYPRGGIFFATSN